MKKLKRLVSLLLAVIMMMGLCAVQAGAAGNGSITIYNTSSESVDYAIYRMFDLTYDSTNDAYLYTVSSAWLGFFWNSTSSSTATAVEDFVTVTYSSVDDKYYVEWTGDQSTTNVQAFGQLASAYAEDNKVSNNGTVTVAANSSGTISNLDLGYYLVTSGLGSLVAIDTTATAATVYDKNAKPTIEKLVGTDGTTYSAACTADLTDKLYYQITITGVDESTTLILHDVLPDGYAVSGDITVKLYSNSTTYTTLTADTDYVLTNPTISCTSNVTGCDFEINFANLLAETSSGEKYYDYILSLSNPSAAYIVVEYSVTVDEARKVSISEAGETAVANTNTAVLSVSTDPDDDKTSTANTYIYELYIYKYENGTYSKALSGAVFTLSYTEGSDTYYAVVDTNGYLTGWTTTASDASSLKTDADGFIHVLGLDVGVEYTLTETAAPTGYQIPSPNTTTVTLTASSYALQTTGLTNYNDSKYAVEVANSTSSSMPTTGGIGTTIFYVVGGILVLGAVILIITRKRMKSDEE